jgi:signal transduction histidine kinase
MAPNSNVPPDVSVLLVDDRPPNLLSLEAALEGLGVAVAQARSGDEALRHLLTRDFAVVLLDVEMPGMDGYETAALMRSRERSRHTPIIFLTALDANPAAVFKGYSVGAVDYLSKPIDPEILRSKVRVFVDLFLKSEQLRRQTERLERLERRERDRASQLEEAVNELDSFVYTVSHDLRAPLRAMHGFGQALLEDCGGRLDELGRDYARRILDASRRMDLLVQDLLAYSRLTRAEIELETIPLQGLVQEVLEHMEIELAERGAQVGVDDSLPTVRGNRLMLAQALTNLLSNAAKFTAPGIAPRVRVRAAREGPRIRVRVEDNGIGIAAEYHERIFRLFERLNPVETYPGTGIGLAIVRKALSRMGGRVGVESAPGKGSCFWIELPYAEGPHESHRLHHSAGRRRPE